MLVSILKNKTIMMMKKIYLLLVLNILIVLSANAQGVIFSESFESTFPPTGWIIKNNGLGNSWTQYTATTNAYSGTKAMQYTYNVTNNANAWAFTPPIVMSNTPVTVSFWVKVASATFAENLKLTVGTDTVVASQTTLLDSASLININYRRWSVTYTPPAAGNYRFGFNCYSAADKYNLFVDSITITQLQPICTGTPLPGTVFSSYASVCPAAGFMLSDTGSTTGVSGLTYQWQSSPNGSNWTDIAGATSANDSIKTQSGATYYRRATTCTGSNSTTYSNSVLVAVNPAAICYCSPTNGITLHSSVGPTIDTVTISGTVLNNISGVVPTNGYTLFNDTTMMPSLQQAVTYSLKTTYQSAAIASVWFDWDQNGSFDSSEWKQITISGTNATINFTVPANAKIGKTVMRIRSRTTAATNGAINACTSFGSGETEDYLINIFSATPCTGTPNGGTILASANPICSNTTLVLTDSGATSAGALTYQWQSSSNGSAWTNIVGANNLSYSINGLTTSTYFRRVTTCTASSQIGNSNGLLINVNPLILCSCNPNTGTILHSSTSVLIDSVTIVGTSLVSNTGITAPTTGYSVYTDTTKTPSLMLNTSYTLQTHYTGTAVGSVWFDWNQNGTFESTEWSQLVLSGTSAKINFTVPVNAMLGKTIMRIRSRSSGSPNAATDACTTFASGETEDYLINIIAAVPCSGTPNGGTVLASANPICPATVVVLTDTGATSSVTGLTYQWQSSANGTAWNDIVGANNLSDSVLGLTTATYFRRVTTCSVSGQKGYSNGLQININPTALCFCSPSNGTTLHSFTSVLIDSVSIVGTSLINNTGTTAPTSGYTQFADTTKMPSLQQGLVYTVQTHFTGTAIGSAWFDWNQNGTFESNEWSQLVLSGTSAKINITVPTSALLGKTIMRIRSRSSGSPNAATDACTTFASGETEDYLIKVVAAPSCTGTPNAGTVVSSANPICSSNILVLTDTGSTKGVGGLLYQWQSSINGTTWTDLPAATLEIDSVKNLTTSTYFRRATTCSTSNIKVYSNALLINVNPIAQCICNPTNGTTLHSGTSPDIDTVIIAGTVLSNITGSNSPASGYTLYTDTALIPSLNTSSTYSLHTSYNGGAAIGSVWFDWNQNGSFEASEWTQLTVSGTAATINFTVPANALPGNTIMRIRARLTANPNAATDACTNFASGETEDYTIKVVSTNLSIQGNIVYPNANRIPNAKIIVTGTKLDSTIATGSYSFSVPVGGNYTIKGSKNNDVNKANGVTTLDLALVQSHILSKNLLNSPYKIIAADVNGDNKITTLDLVYMKRMILGFDTIYPSKKLWVFVDSNYVFTTPSNPFPYKDSISFTSLIDNKSKQTFIGIKLGDVNWDWNPLLAKPVNNSATKINDELKLETDDKIIIE